MSDSYQPKPEHKFSFGLWTVGNVGGDPFGDPVREQMSPVGIVHMLAEVGAWGVNLHDNDLVPIDATPAERDKIVADFKKALSGTGIVARRLIDAKLVAAVEAKQEKGSIALEATGAISDDGIIDPRDTRTVLGICLSVVRNAPVEGADGYGVFRL